MRPPRSRRDASGFHHGTNQSAVRVTRQAVTCSAVLPSRRQCHCTHEGPIRQSFWEWAAYATIRTESLYCCAAAGSWIAIALRTRGESSCGFVELERDLAHRLAARADQRIQHAPRLAREALLLRCLPARNQTHRGGMQCHFFFLILKKEEKNIGDYTASVSEYLSSL